MTLASVFQVGSKERPIKSYLVLLLAFIEENVGELLNCQEGKPVNSYLGEISLKRPEKSSGPMCCSQLSS